MSRKNSHTALDEITKDGAFKRTASGFRDVVSPDAGAKYPPAANRYHLYVSLACPWAAGTLTALRMKGLEDVIGYSAVHPTWGRSRPDDPNDTHCGWHFRAPGSPAVPNPAGFGSIECDDANVPCPMGCKTIRDLYEKSTVPDKCFKYTTPVLWDKETGAIINNESTEILRMLDTAFQTFAKHPEVELHPPEAEAEAQELNKWIYADINNGVYRAGFAKSQAAYDAAVNDVFAALDRADALLATRRFITRSGKFTWLDLRLFQTLVRFDPVYNVYFKCNRKRVADYPHLLGYVRDCYQSFEPVRRTVNMRHIKAHYYTSHPHYNRFAVIPTSDGADLNVSPHGREHLRDGHQKGGADPPVPPSQ